MSTTTTIKAVSFDLDGTLYSSAKLKGPVLWATFPRWRTMRVGRRVREALRGQRFVDGEALLQHEATIAAERLDRSVDTTREALRRVFDHDVVRVLPKVGARIEARAVLEALVARDIAICVISDRGSVAEKLGAVGLADLPWRALISADDVGALKPDPLLFTQAAMACGVDIKHLLHVGDRDDCDGAGARAAGARVVIIDALAPRPLDVVLPAIDALP